MEAGRRLDNRAAVEVDTSGAKIGPVLRRSIDRSRRLAPRATAGTRLPQTATWRFVGSAPPPRLACRAAFPVAEKLKLIASGPSVKMHVMCIWWSKYGEDVPTLWPEQMTGLATLDLECAFELLFFGSRKLL